MRTIPILLLASLSLSSGAVAADQDGESVSAFMKCARIAGDAQRLSCYDRLATELIELGVSSPADTSAGSTPPAPPSTGQPTVAEAPAPAPAAATQGGAGAAAEEDQFGKEMVEVSADKDIKVIQSRYKGEFTGWEGDTVFPLENGQVWQQIQSGRMVWKATNPMITIKRGLMGGYQLSVEGVNKRVRVKRIK